MSSCTFCGEYAGSSIKVPHDYLPDLLQVPVTYVILVDLPACIECKEVLDEVAFHSIEGAAGYISTVYQERYQHLLSTVNWTQAELQELGHNLRTGIEISLKNQLETVARIEHCDRVQTYGPTIAEDIQDEMRFQVLSHHPERNESSKVVSQSNSKLPETALRKTLPETTHDDDVAVDDRVSQGSKSDHRSRERVVDSVPAASLPNACSRSQLQTSPTKTDKLPLNAIIEILVASCKSSSAEGVTTYNLLSPEAAASEHRTSAVVAMIAASGRDGAHVGSIADELLATLDDLGFSNVALTGLQACEWVVMDIGQVVINVLRRDYYEEHDVDSLRMAHQRGRSDVRDAHR